MNTQPKVALGTWSWSVTEEGQNGGNEVFGNHLTQADLKPVFDAGMKAGLTLWDTAYVYGMGQSETIVGNLLKEYDRETVILSTKFTPQFRNRDAREPVREMLEKSFQNLGVDTVDIYWIHNPSHFEEWVQGLIPLAKEGKIRKMGVSNHNLSQIKRAEEILEAEGLKLSCVQNHYSLLYRSSEFGGILDYCKEKGMDFFAYMSLEQGALSGKYDRNNLMPEDSQRGKFYNPLLPAMNPLLVTMKEIGAAHDATAAEVAIAYTIAKGALPLVGVTKVEQVLQAKKASEIDFTPAEIQTLEKMAESTGVDAKGYWEKPMA